MALVVLAQLIDLYMLIVLGAVIISWLKLPPTNTVAIMLHRLTEPALGPIRRVAATGGRPRLLATCAADRAAIPQTAALDTTPFGGVGALIQRGGRAVAGMLTIATAGGSST